jgi:hypothetical protein
MCEVNGPIPSNGDRLRNRGRVLTYSDQRGHEMDEEEDQQFSLRVEIGNEAKPGTWLEVPPGILKELLFAFPR